MSSPVKEESNEYAEYAARLKDQGNEAFKQGDIQQSITFYTQAIDMDPDNHVYYSNRSAGIHSFMDLKLNVFSVRINYCLACLVWFNLICSGVNYVNLCECECSAYMKADSKSKALWDANKCVELAPDWSKGYNRLGTAQHSLGRFEAAIDSYKKGSSCLMPLLFSAMSILIDMYTCI
jgi:tetratricopeptide (TPR) repeat protein